MLSDYLWAAREAFGSLLKAINSSVALVWRTIKDKSGTTDGQSRRHNLPRLGVINDYLRVKKLNVQRGVFIITRSPYSSSRSKSTKKSGAVTPTCNACSN